MFFFQETNNRLSTGTQNSSGRSGSTSLRRPSLPVKGQKQATKTRQQSSTTLPVQASFLNRPGNSSFSTSQSARTGFLGSGRKGQVGGKLKKKHKFFNKSSTTIS